MSEEKGPFTKTDQSDDMVPFDPAKVARAIFCEEKTDQKRGFGEDFNLYGDAKRINDTPPDKANIPPSEPAQ